MTNNNPNCVFICSAESADDAADLYKKGAAYVMMPHFIGSEKIGTFLQKSGLSKMEFSRFREKHLQHLETYFALERDDDEYEGGLNP